MALFLSVKNVVNIDFGTFIDMWLILMNSSNTFVPIFDFQIHSLMSCLNKIFIVRPENHSECSLIYGVISALMKPILEHTTNIRCSLLGENEQIKYLE